MLQGYSQLIFEGVSGIQLVGKGNFLLAFFSDRQRRDNGVNFLRLQGRDQRIEIAFHKGTLGIYAFAQLFGQIDIKADQLTFGIF